MDGCKYISQVGQIYLAILTNIICTFDEWRDSQGKCQVCGKMEGSTKTVHTVDIHEGCYLAIMTQNTHFFSCSSLFLIRTSGDSHNQAGFKHINTYQACKGQLHLILSIKIVQCRISHGLSPQRARRTKSLGPSCPFCPSCIAGGPSQQQLNQQHPRQTKPDEGRL